MAVRREITSDSRTCRLRRARGDCHRRRAGGRGRQGRDGVAATRPRVDGRRCAPRRRWSRLNQRHGFRLPGCAWPEEHGGRKFAEFCENGAKAVAEEATKRVVTPSSSPGTRSPSWPQQTRVLAVASRAGSPTRWCCGPAPTTTEPIAWDDAYRSDRRRAARLWTARTRRCSTPRAAPATRRRSLPVVGPQLRHEQPAGLLEHVPRVVGRRADRGDRHRQGLGDRRGHRRRPT